MPVALKGEKRAFCDQVWDALFSSIAASKSLNRDQRRVYDFLWRHVDVRTRVYGRSLGVAAMARRLGMSDAALARALEALCAKGFAQRLPPHVRRPIRLSLNPLLIESAYEETKRLYPGLLAS